MIRVTALVSGYGANLRALLDCWFFRQFPNFELVAAISSTPDAYALERAKEAGLETYVVERDIFPNNASFSNAVLNKLRDLDTDLVVAAGFSEKLEFPLLRYYSGRIIAVVPSLLPAFSGQGDYHDCEGLMRRILASGTRYTGATAYFMAKEDDGLGPIICQQVIPVQPDDTPESLQDRIMREGEWKVLPDAVRLYCEGRLTIRDGKVLIAPAPGPKTEEAPAPAPAAESAPEEGAPQEGEEVHGNQ